MPEPELQPGSVSIERVETVTAELGQQLYGLAHLLNPEVTEDQFKVALDDLAASPTGYLFVARQHDSGPAIGMLTMIYYPSLTRKGGKAAWIEDVVVDESSRGMSLGRKLVFTAIDQARQIGLSQVNLTSNPQRVEANKLYQSIGFQPYDTNYYRYEMSK